MSREWAATEVLLDVTVCFTLLVFSSPNTFEAGASGIISFVATGQDLPLPIEVRTAVAAILTVALLFLLFSSITIFLLEQYIDSKELYEEAKQDSS